MDIFVKNDGEKFKPMGELEGKSFPKESVMENMMEESLENIPLEASSGSKLLVLGRQIETGSGPLDILAIDDSGMIYIVETKLNNNTDRRRIIAQLFDYAAGLWNNFKDFERFEKAVKEKNDNQSIFDLVKTPMHLLIRELASRCRMKTDKIYQTRLEKIWRMEYSNLSRCGINGKKN